MELTQTSLLDNYITNFSNGFLFDPFDDNQFLFPLNNTPFSQQNLPADPLFPFPIYPSSLDSFTIPHDVSYDHDPIQQLMCEGQYGVFGGDQQYHEETTNLCKVETEFGRTPNVTDSKMDLGGENNNNNNNKKAKRSDGVPSKNLMAERRRRKRLNDRLLMLRSIVPKVSKMDRTAILGDAIEYMKELLEKIKQLQEEDCIKATTNETKSANNYIGMKPNDPTMNSQKFDVERTDSDTRIEIRCATKPGLLLSTINTIEALGLDIQQCAISCFGDFSLQASCSEVMEQPLKINSENMKLALCENAGYGHRCP